MGGRQSLVLLLDEQDSFLRAATDFLITLYKRSPPQMDNNRKPKAKDLREGVRQQGGELMTEQFTGRPVYTEQVGQSTAEVYQYGGIYSVLLMGGRVACFLA